MKLFIDLEQWNRLNDKQKAAWNKDRELPCWEDRIMTTTLPGKLINPPSLQDLIEFLYKQETILMESEDRMSPVQGWIINRDFYVKELIDGLWERVKTYLK